MDFSKLKLHGRTYFDDNNLVLDNSNTGFSLSFTGKKLSIVYKATCSIGENKVLLVIDDQELKLTLPNANVFIEYDLLTNINDDIHNVTFVKLIENQYSKIVIKDIICNEILEFNHKYDLNLEFYGDSLTCGFGVLGSDPEINSDNEDSSKSFAYLTAKGLNADYSMHSYSGISVGVKIYADILMKDVYNQVSFTNTEKYSFSFKPDCIVIYLGTNDSAGISNGNGTIDEFINSYKELLNNITLIHKDTPIVLCYGMCNILDSVNNAIKSLEDINNQIYICEFKPLDIGSVNHPGVKANYNNSILLQNTITNILKLS